MAVLFKLECGHYATSKVVPILQYPTDIHYVWCPTCRNLQNPPLRVFPFAWVTIVSVNDDLRNVPPETPQVLPCDIMRLQPGRPRGRTEYPFPYKYTGRFNIEGPKYQQLPRRGKLR